jgi:hypothetical protein
MAYLMSISPARYMHGAVSVAANQALTLACRVYENGGTTSAVETSIGLFSSITSNRYLWGTTRGYGSYRANRVIWRNNTTTRSVAGTVDLRSQWSSLMIVVDAGADLALFTNGQADGTLATADSFGTGTYDLVGVGSDYRSASPGLYYNGIMAECAIYAAALGLPEAQQFHAGYSPAHVRPDALLHHWPLVRDLGDRVGGATLTPVNSPTINVHPRVRARRRRKLITVPAGIGLADYARGNWRGVARGTKRGAS